MTKNFKGDKKDPIRTLTGPAEKAFVKAVVPKIPSWIHGHQLTLMSLPISLGILAAGFLAQDNINWLTLSSALIAMQWLTDSLDGAIGRYRDAGIPRWGFYMDHFLDYIFMVAIVLSYALLLSGPAREQMLLMIPLLGGFMMNAYLRFGAIQQFKISYLFVGPTELRILGILFNTLLMFIGIEFIIPALPYALGAFTAGLILVVYRTQKEIWAIDMTEHAK